MESFRVRLNCIDHYQATPLPEFDPPVPKSAYGADSSKERPRISVIRVFGATETGQKVLLHVHGALQYTYIEYTGSLTPEDVSIAIRTLWLSIDHALAISYRKNVYDGDNQYVAHISLVKGIPFYGFHVGYKFYLKIYLLNPMHMTRLADLLREGAVMKRVLQPYESHMQYLAQWMCDYNLYGCAYMDCAKVKFRGPIPKYLELRNTAHPWHDRSIPPDLVSDESSLPKLSYCALEADLCVQDILNRQSIGTRPLHHDFVERLQPLPTDVKLVPSMAGLWRDETRRRKIRMGLKDPNSSPFPPEVLITMSADPRNMSPGGWIHEEEYRQKIAQLAAQEKINSDGQKLAFDTFVKPIPLQDTIQTALESIEDLYSHNMQSLRESDSDVNDPHGSQAVIDESRVQNVADAEQRDSGVMHNSADGLSSDSHDLPSSNKTTSTRVMSPISSGEYARLGVRKRGDMSHASEDDFEIPQDYVAEISPAKPRIKRTRTEQDQLSKPFKRRRILTDEGEYAQPDLLSQLESDRDHFLHGVRESTYEEQELEAMDNLLEEHEHLELNKSTVTRDSPIKNGSQGRISSQKSTLNFPVVKNSKDPNTIARLSQHSSPVKSQSQKSPEKGSSWTMTPKSAQKTDSMTNKTPGSATATRSTENILPPPLKLTGLTASRGANVFVFQYRPPRKNQILSSMRSLGIPDVIYQEAYYSKQDDVLERQREYAGKEFKLESITLPYLPDFDPTGTSPAIQGRRPPIQLDLSTEDLTDRQRRQRCTIKRWTIAKPPPRRIDMISWLEQDISKDNSSVQPIVSEKKDLDSQIAGATQKNKYGFKYSQEQATTSVQHETQYMSVMSLEAHVNSRGSLTPNPEEDPISCIFWCVQTDDEDVVINTGKEGVHAGIIVIADDPLIGKKIGRNVTIDVEQEETELDALTKMVDIVRLYDPDILTGYEVHNSSWGYLIERARLKYDLNLCDEISRMKSQSHGRFGKDEDRWGFNQTSTIRVTGRHTVNIWRAMRGELNLLQYTMENVAYHLMHRRIPHYSFSDLTKWYKSKNPRNLSKVIEYFTSRVQLDLEILEANELVPRTSEQARLLGVDWYSVISRGSQFKVESLMFRLAKPENFILVSPSRRQVGGQNALECLPLVMEPQSDFYSSPMLVLDFQSLYPSVMIAYNYCYSTFLGRIVGWRGTNKMGFSDYRRQSRLVELLADYINIAPNGIMYAKTEIRKSLLAKMLTEILETRVMVKSGMKVDKDDKTLQTLLNNRQLALKLIANVTYGYTSASFSGRMPCVEIADSIVQTGRETLEKAIALIHSVEKWGAEVVYGDTDSLFVYLKGRTRQQAFDIGDEIAETITKLNPRPVKLKFEKVYHPCVLLAKKRYVGFKYESREQTKPDFDAKGIETVRRDGTPAEQKIEENALKILFRGADLSQVKAYFQAQCAKIMRGKVSIQDFCFAREVKLGSYSDKGPPPPGALISARRMLEDPRLEPQYGERVPYVVVTGGPGARLIDRCVAPDVLLNDAQSELDAEYYISKNIIPPLERIFNLVGANVRQWYDEMPKYQRIRRVEGTIAVDGAEGPLKKTLELYMKSSNCIVCKESLDSDLPLCSSCADQAPQSLLYLQSKLIKSERKASQLAKVCRSCSGLGWNEEIRCDSKDCPVFYSRTRQSAALSNTRAQILPVVRLLENKEMESMEW